MYQPGQWLDFTVPHATWMGGFSISSGPQQHGTSTKRTTDIENVNNCIQIAVKKSNHPPALWVTNQSKVGDEILVKVGGTCTLSSQHASSPAIFVAGGIGISPVLGLLRHHVADERPSVQFFYSTKTQEELVFRNELTQLLRPKDCLTVTLTQATQWNFTPNFPHNIQTNYQLGRKNALKDFLVDTTTTPSESYVSKESNDTAYPVFYLCGPPGMIDDAVFVLHEELGVNRDQVVYERWW